MSAASRRPSATAPCGERHTTQLLGVRRGIGDLNHGVEVWADAFVGMLELRSRLPQRGRGLLGVANCRPALLISSPGAAWAQLGGGDGGLELHGPHFPAAACGPVEGNGLAGPGITYLRDGIRYRPTKPCWCGVGRREALVKPTRLPVQAIPQMMQRMATPNGSAHMITAFGRSLHDVALGQHLGLAGIIICLVIESGRCSTGDAGFSAVGLPQWLCRQPDREHSDRRRIRCCSCIGYALAWITTRPATPRNAVAHAAAECRTGIQG